MLMVLKHVNDAMHSIGIEGFRVCTLAAALSHRTVYIICLFDQGSLIEQGSLLLQVFKVPAVYITVLMVCYKMKGFISCVGWQGPGVS